MARTARPGFSVLELSVANCLMAVLVMSVSSVLVQLGRPTTDAVRRLELQRQALVAESFLKRDLGGAHPNVVRGTKSQGMEVGRKAHDGSELWICFDDGSLDKTAQWGHPDMLVRYYVRDGQLIRYNERESHALCVATHVTDFAVVQEFGAITIDMTLKRGTSEMRRIFQCTARP